MNAETVIVKEDSYFERNSPWLTPAGATFIIVITPFLVTAFDVQLPLPGWLIVLFGFVGCLWTGFCSMQVDTVSSKVVRFLSAATILASLLVLVLR